jgi:hypothetical protein
MHEFSVSKDMETKKEDDIRRVPTYLLVYFRPLIAKEFKISVEHGRVTTLNVTKH